MGVKIQFLINNKIEIESNDEAYKSNIQDVTDEYIAISIPVRDGKYLPLAKGEKVTGLYYYDKDIYKFHTVVIGRKIDRILLIILKRPENVTMIQRRNFARVPFMINVYCALIRTEKDINTINDNQIEFFDAYTLDVSGGGLRLAVDRKLESRIRKGNILMLTIPIEDQNLTVEGEIIRVENDRKNSKIICGLVFRDLDRKTREAIVKLVFEIMREQMRKGAKGD